MQDARGRRDRVGGPQASLGDQRLEGAWDRKVPVDEKLELGVEVKAPKRRDQLDHVPPDPALSRERVLERLSVEESRAAVHINWVPG